MTRLDEMTRAKLSKLINRVADDIWQLRTIAVALLDEQTEEPNLPDLDEFLNGVEIPAETEQEKPLIEVSNIEPMKRTYKDICLPKKKSRWASLGQVATYDLCKFMKEEFPAIDTRSISIACSKLGIETYMHGHSKYINHMMADVIADYFREGR